MARRHPKTHVLPELNFKTFGTPDDPHEKAMAEMRATSDALEDGDIVGFIMQFPWADGYAVYRVTKERPLTLQHIDYGDAWQVPDAHLRGIRFEDVVQAQMRARARRKLFGPKEA